ncbi:MAG: hypothetical protein WEA61_05050 [Anaerolineales bacterium]
MRKPSLALVFVFAILLAACSLTAPQAKPRFDVISVKDFYPEAYDLALEWSSSPLLVEVKGVIAFDHPLADHEAELVYGFESSEKEFSVFTVTCSTTSCQGQAVGNVFLKPAADDRADSPRTPIDVASLKIDSIEAVVIGEYVGGFKCVLVDTWTGWGEFGLGNAAQMVWQVNFHCPSWGEMEVHIDPYNGDVLIIERLPSLPSPLN